MGVRNKFFFKSISRLSSTNFEQYHQPSCTWLQFRGYQEKIDGVVLLLRTSF
jgi:hypothetical protein